MARKVSISKESRYKVADIIADSIAIDAEAVRTNYKLYFREVITMPIKSKGVVTSLEEKYVEDAAKHITALVLRRLSTPKLVRTVVDIAD